MISVSEALARLFDLIRPLDSEEVPLAHAAGRVLAAPMVASRAQPPFAASAMDGYALRAADLAPGARLRVIGEAPAGRAFAGRLGVGEAVRIFTGAPVPEGADCVAIQEDVARDGDLISVIGPAAPGDNIRPAGGDFHPGDAVAAPRRLRPFDLALAAAMNLPTLTVARRPVVALLATGDELVMPGEAPEPDQILASNAFALRAMFQAEGAEVRLLPIARDTEASLEAAFALAAGADMLVTIGGASAGDHDLVGPVADRLGTDRAFYKVALRPGKPLMAGRLGRMAVIGLPGNPVSSVVCAHVFVLPMLRALQGLPAEPAPRRLVPLAVDLPANGRREHYMRARLLPDGTVAPFDSQDSSLLTVLAAADALLIRPIHDPARPAGTEVAYLPI